MAEELANRALSFTLHPETGLFEVRGAKRSIEGASVGLHYRIGEVRLPLHWTGEFRRGSIERWEVESSPFGKQRRVRLTSRIDDLDMALEIAIPEDRPFLLWRLSARNLGPVPMALDDWDLLRADATSPEEGPEPAYFVPGWQSWSWAGALGRRQRPGRTRLGPFSRALQGPAFPSRKVTSEMFGVRGDRRSREGILLGFLSQREQLGSVELSPHLRLWAHGDGAVLEPGAHTTTDWACLQFLDVDAEEPLGPYLDAAAAESGARVPPADATPRGWCTWYQYFNRVTERDVYANLEAAKALRNELPLRLFQLDDGYQAQVGDWLERNAKFPGELGQLAGAVKAAGMQPGLWLAPFSAHPESRLAKEHPDWILRRAGGRAVNAGFVFDCWCRALDVTNPVVRAHVAQVIRTAAKEWGFGLLKLDFLYMGALRGKAHDPRLTRAQAIRLALEAVREAAGPGTFLLGCGCPLGSGLGIFDGMRISADVAPAWRPKRKRISWLVRAEPELPSARNAIHNTLARAPLHRRWWLNDPDCLLVRDFDTELTLEEVYSLASAIALSGGVLLLSDDLTKLKPERRRIAERLLPLVGRPARALDWIDSREPSRMALRVDGAAGPAWVVGLFNWKDSAQTLRFPLAALGEKAEGPWHAVDFWRQRYQRVDGGELAVPGVPAHGCVLATLRPARGGAQWVGSDLHFTQSSELSRWEVRDGSVHLELELGREAAGEIWVQLGEGVHRIPVKVPGRAELDVRFAS